MFLRKTKHCPMLNKDKVTFLHYIQIHSDLAFLVVKFCRKTIAILCQEKVVDDSKKKSINVYQRF